MTDDRKAMNRALKLFLVPQVEALGFSGKFPHFKRKVGSEYQLLMVFFDKYGGSFYLDAGRVSDSEFAHQQDFYQSRGKALNESQLTAGHANWKKRARLSPNGFVRGKNHTFVFGPDSTIPGPHPHQAEKHFNKIALQAATHLAEHVDGFFSGAP